MRTELSAEGTAVIFIVILVPPLLLCAVLALGRYEEHIFGPRTPEPAHRRAPLPEHLRPVPGTGRRHAPPTLTGPVPAHRRRPGRRAA
ncbi:hypothetical protein [Streptomyces sp. NPDC051567]|uniref:hypothetical protein n=1 Tax=Streptomyces sp. NPDC051567 TaxID=3365660 RepID=UPI0037A202B6